MVSKDLILIHSLSLTAGLLGQALCQAVEGIQKANETTSASGWLAQQGKWAQKQIITSSCVGARGTSAGWIGPVF